MTTKESSEKTNTFHQSLAVPFEHPVTSLSISPQGRDAVLAAKRGLYVLDLEHPFEPARIFQHVSKWDVADVQWNPHMSRNSWIASTSNQKALVWNIHRPGNSHVELMLAKHLRAISDMHWSPFMPEMLATCSYDAYVYLWDLRQPTLPCHSFCGWTAGATQVKFNTQNEYLLASAHDTDIRVWDTRKGSTPVTLITAHMTKIYGIDWSRTNEKELLTCSQDRLVKIWNVDQSRTCQATIETFSPCWRARFTPFGNGIVTMPQRKDNSLYLWNREMPQTPVYTFSGHSDVPTEFVWRYQRDSQFGDENEYQLITWSKDMHLRMWPISKETVKTVSSPQSQEESYSFPLPSEPIAMGPPRGLEFRTGSDSQLHYHNNRTSPPKSDNTFGAISFSSLSNLHSANSEGVESDTEVEHDLEGELNRVLETFPGVHIDKTNLASRRCTVRLERPDPSGLTTTGNRNIFFQVDIIFPKRYPYTPPFFDIQKTWMLSMMNRTLLSKKLTQIAMNFSRKRKPCMEAAIRYLLGGNATTMVEQIPTSPHSPPTSVQSTSISSVEMEGRAANISDLQAHDSSNHDSSSTDEDDILMMGGHLKTFSRDKDNHSVPFPRLCGAIFTPTGQLIYFKSPLPHPSTTKFTAYTLSTRNQQPILQSQSFSTQPRTYALYENYRSFLLARCPRMLLGGVPTLQDRIQAQEELQEKDRKLDYWLDDEELDDDAPNLYWRPKPTPLVPPENFQTADFLAKLTSFNNKTQAPLKEPRRNSVASIIKSERPPTRNPSGGITPGSSIPDPSPISPIASAGVRPRRKSIGSIHYETNFNEFSDLGIPFQKSSPTIDPIDIQPLDIDMLGMIRKAKKLKRPSMPIQPSSPILEPESEEEDSKFGTVIHIIDLEFLMPLSRVLADRYMISGKDAKSLCIYNQKVVQSLGRKDLQRIWQIAESVVTLECSQMTVMIKTDYKSRLLKQLYSYLESIDDFQTISTIVAVFLNPFLPEQKEPIKLDLKATYTSSPALFMATASNGASIRPNSNLRASLRCTGSLPIQKKPLLTTSIVTHQKTIDPSLLPWIHRYANYLYSLGKYQTRTQLLSLTGLCDTNPSLEIRVVCSCKKTPCICQSKCPFCRLPCKSLATFCLVCEHGGHASCMKQWFKDEAFCITGCGCECTLYQ